MPISIITLSEITDILYAQLSISKNAYGTHDGSPLYPVNFVRDVVLEVDTKIVDIILRTPGHPRRLEYVATANSSTPGVLVNLNNAGGFENRNILKVVITRHDAGVVVAEPAPAAKITQWLNNKVLYGDDDCIDGYYDITDGQLIFTGSQATVHFLNAPKHTSADTTMQAPYEYKGAIIRMALVELLGKDPTKRELKQNFDGLVDIDLAMIRNGEAVPSFEQYQQAR